MPAKIVASLEVSIQIIEKNGLHYTQIHDAEGNLVFEEESLTRQGAACKASDWVMERLFNAR